MQRRGRRSSVERLVRFSQGHWQDNFATEIHRLNHYYKKDFRLSYLHTKDNAEIDLIVERPGRGVIWQNTPSN